jgi:hypothetical protein
MQYHYQSIISANTAKQSTTYGGGGGKKNWPNCAKYNHLIILITDYHSVTDANRVRCNCFYQLTGIYAGGYMYDVMWRVLHGDR